MVRILLLVSLFLLGVLNVWGSVPTTINDFTMPGSQPNQSGSIKTPADCSCHGGYNRAVEPLANWQGSMMAQAARDVLYWATVAIANQDAPASGDLCLRCHTPKGWLEGRSEPTDGSALTADDRQGVLCHFCHKSVKPSPIGVNPYSGNSAYTSGTYPADQTYLAKLSTIPAHSANGMYIVDDLDVRRGPYSSVSPPHDFYYSPFHNDASVCGTCHDVSNPAFSKTPGGDYEPNSFDQPAPDASPYAQFPVERTFSEWKMSAYNSAQGIYAPQFGGNRDTVRTCQDCHMRDVTGKGAQQGSTPTRSDLGLHDLTGGNTFIPMTVIAAFPADGVDPVALDSGIARATRMLKLASSMDLSAVVQGSAFQATVRVTNETGHKLPSGYPEGRRIWINIKAYDSLGNMIYQSGAYDQSAATLAYDSDIKVYEIKPGISQSLAPVVSLPAGPSFHFVLNDTIYKDNRIPPRGFTNANFAAIQSPAVAHTYMDGQYWDDTQYQLPSATSRVISTLYYQTTTREMAEFLRDENTTNSDGTRYYNLWSTYGKSAPVVMKADTLLLTPFGTNQAPVLATIGNKAIAENSSLSFRVSATDGDGNSVSLTASPIPNGAIFADSANGAGSLVWTPSYSQAGSYNITFKANDGQAVDSEVVTITVTNVNRAPSLAAIGAKGTAENQPLVFNISGSDPDGTPLTLSASGLPSGASFTDNGNSTGGFNWTPTFSQAGSYPVIFIASDGSLADSESVVITVSNVNRPPVLDAIANKTASIGVQLAFAITAADPDADSVSLQVKNLPTGASLSEVGWNVSLNRFVANFTWTPILGQEGTYTDPIAVAQDQSDSTLQPFQIVVTFQCCVGTVGNINKSATEIPDLSDLSLLISYLTMSPRPILPCLEEANVNGSGTIDLSDLSLLISYLTVSPRPTLPDCP